MSEWSTVVWVGTYYLLIQIFRHFISSECTSSNTATTVSCETTKLLDQCLVTYWRNTFVSASSWDVSKWLVSVSGLADSIEWHHWNHHQQLVSVVWVAKTTSALFILGWDQVSHLAGRGMTRLSVILLTGWELLFISSWFIISVNVDALEARRACRRDQVKLSIFPFGRQGDDPTFSHSSDRLGTSVHLFLVHNICQCRCTWSTSGLQERSGKTIRFPIWQAGGWPDFQSFFWPAGNFCSSLPGL